MTNIHPIIVFIAMGVLSSCSDSGDSADGEGDGTSNIPSEEVVLDATEFTYSLTQSIEGLPLWTTPCTHKALTNERPPSAEQSGLRLFAAKGEFEPTQLLVGPASGSISVSLDPFSSLGDGYRSTLYRAEYEAGYAEHLVPIVDGEEILLSDDHALPLWLDLYIPEAAVAGEHEITLRVRRGETEIAVPVPGTRTTSTSRIRRVLPRTTRWSSTATPT